MFHPTVGDAVRELARLYIDPANPRFYGVKAFAKRIFPLKTDDNAYTALMNCTAEKRSEKFSDEEWMAIIRIGYEQGRHFVAEHFVGVEYVLTPVEREKIAKRARRQQLAYHLAEVARLSQEDE